MRAPRGSPYASIVFDARARGKKTSTSRAALSLASGERQRLLVTAIFRPDKVSAVKFTREPRANERPRGWRAKIRKLEDFFFSAERPIVPVRDPAWCGGVSRVYDWSFESCGGKVGCTAIGGGLRAVRFSFFRGR